MYSMAVRSVSTLESFLFTGVVGTCFLKVANPSLTSLTRFLSLSFRRSIDTCSFFMHCGVLHLARCLLFFLLAHEECLFGSDESLDPLVDFEEPLEAVDIGESSWISREVGELKEEYSELEVGEGVSSQLSSDKSISLRFGNGKFSASGISILNRETLGGGGMQSSFLF